MIDLATGTLFLLFLNLAAAAAGALLAWRARLRRAGALLLLGSVASAAALLAFSTRLSERLFQQRLIAADLYNLLYHRQHFLWDAAIVLAFLLGWWLHGRGRGWGPGLLAVSAAAFAALLARAPSEPQLLPHPLLVAAALGCLVYLAAPRVRWAAAIPLVLSGAVLAGLLHATANRFAVRLESIPEEKSLAVPAGFAIQVFAQLTEPPTALSHGGDGALYVSTLSGSVLRLVDEDGDGASDRGRVLLQSLGWPLGIVWHAGQVYVSVSDPAERDSGYILVIDDAHGGGLVEQPREIVSGLPTGGYPTHQNNNLALGPDERLYVGIGSTTDHQEETAQYAASIVSFELDGSDLQVFATGLRNPYGLAFSPDGRLFATDNGPDNLDETLLYVPPDELNLIVAGGDYGFPRYFGAAPAESGTISPVALFTMETVPTGLHVYRGSQYPAEYRGDVFVALWQRGGHPNGLGSPRYGQRVARITLRETSAGWRATDRDFATGLEAPIDVEEGPAGELYIADMNTSRIYRVTYSGP